MAEKCIPAARGTLVLRYSVGHNGIVQHTAALQHSAGLEQRHS